MSSPGGVHGALSFGEHCLGASMVDIVGGQHGNAPMAVLGVVPREERAAVAGRRLDAGEAAWETRVVLQSLELRLGERVIVGYAYPVASGGSIA